MKKIIFPLIFATLLCSLLIPTHSTARVYLDISSAESRKIPVAVPYFADKKNPGIISANGNKMAALAGQALSVHGFISVIPSTNYRNDRASRWKTIGADYVLLGTYDTDTNGMVLELRFLETNNNKMIAGKRYRSSWSKNEKMILKFCDEVILQLTGEKGISNTQLAYVSDKSGHKEVYLTDILGKKTRQVTRHRSITVSPRFSPDSKKLAYSSYHRGTQILYVTDLSQSSTTKAISWKKGLNVAPSWSPTDNTMITTLSKDGNPDQYLMTTSGKIIKRLTKNKGINVSASWAPDGLRFTFVSDRSGTPQIYTMDTRTKRVKRLTYSGAENTTPVWSPKGDLIAYTSNQGGNYHLFVINPDGSNPVQLTKYWGDHESPSWSPDGKQLVFSRSRNTQKNLCRIILRGKGVIPISNLKGNQTYPQWSQRLTY